MERPLKVTAALDVPEETGSPRRQEAGEDLALHPYAVNPASAS